MGGSAVDRLNAGQVDGFTREVEGASDEDRIGRAEMLFASVGATLEHRSEGRAYYHPATDRIVLPRFEEFRDAVAYYATSAHEHAHWTGHRDRLARDLSARFGECAYAMEELTAELSAAFLCAALGISPEPRPDHGAYLQHWLKVLRSDPKALHHVASKAQAATDYLLELGAAAMN